MTRIVLQGKKVYNTFENESVQEIMELHIKAQDKAIGDIREAADTLFDLTGSIDKKQLKKIDKLAKLIRDNVKFLTSEYTLVDGGETYKIGEDE